MHITPMETWTSCALVRTSSATDSLHTWVRKAEGGSRERRNKCKTGCMILGTSVLKPCRACQCAGRMLGPGLIWGSGQYKNTNQCTVLHWALGKARGIIKTVNGMSSFSTLFLLAHIQTFSLEEEFDRYPILDLCIYIYEWLRSRSRSCS